MNRNIVKTLVIIILAIIIFGAFYLINQAKIINPIISAQNSSSDYYADSSVEEIAKIAAPAVEDFASQDANESASSRTARLSLHFSGDSPVYNYIQKNINLSIRKTTAKVVTVRSSESEGGTLNIIVNIILTSYTNTEPSTKDQTYWVSLVKTSDGSMIPYDLGEIAQ